MNKILNHIRRFKPSYTIYNFLNQKKLRHNISAYKKYGLKRALYKPLDTQVLSKLSFSKEDLPWLDRHAYLDEVEQTKEFQLLDMESKDHIRFWFKNGYLILHDFFSHNLVEKINNEIDLLLKTGQVSFKYGNKIMFANKVSDLIASITINDGLLSKLKQILGTNVVPFQTINFIQGSQQKAHSDSVHMTTFPPGFLIAVWIALEDIEVGQGPLFYYPASHRFSYLMKPHFQSGDSRLFIGDYSYKNYEHAVDEVIRSNNPTKKVFLAKKGDVLIWHANLLHGGEPIMQEGATRKSMVIHYFGTDAIKYHEITGRPALMD